MGLKERLRERARIAYKTRTLHKEYPRAYEKAVKGTKINPKKVVFLEVRQSELSDSFSEIYKALEARGDYELVSICIQEGMTDRLTVRQNCLKAIPQMVDAAWILTNDSCYFLSCLPLRRGQKVIQLWHACGAFKKFGFSTVGTGFGTTEEDLKRFPVHQNMHYVTVSSLAVREPYIEALKKQRFRVQAAGVSRTDVYYDPERKAEAYQAVDAYLTAHGLPALSAGKKRKILLYAPTFRGKVADAVSPDVLDYEQMHRKLGDEWVILCKHHPFVKNPPAVPENCKGYVLDVTQDLPIEQLLMTADVLMTDYSSVIFEYSLMERPMLFLDYDLEEYTAERGFYFPLEELTPGPVVRSTDEVIEALQHVEEWFDPDAMQAFRQKFMGRCDGHATERLLQIMDMRGYKPKKKKKKKNPEEEENLLNNTEEPLTAETSEDAATVEESTVEKYRNNEPDEADEVDDVEEADEDEETDDAEN